MGSRSEMNPTHCRILIGNARKAIMMMQNIIEKNDSNQNKTSEWIQNHWMKDISLEGMECIHICPVCYRNPATGDWSNCPE